MRILARLAPAVASLALLAVADPAAADDDQAAQLAASCAACHHDGGRVGGIPAIAGLKEEGIVRAMLAYKSGERASHLMRVVAASLSNVEIAIVARYLAATGGAGTQ